MSTQVLSETTNNVHLRFIIKLNFPVKSIFQVFYCIRQVSCSLNPKLKFLFSYGF